MKGEEKETTEKQAEEELEFLSNFSLSDLVADLEKTIEEHDIRSDVRGLGPKQSYKDSQIDNIGLPSHFFQKK